MVASAAKAGPVTKKTEANKNCGPPLRNRCLLLRGTLPKRTALRGKYGVCSFPSKPGVYFEKAKPTFMLQPYVIGIDVGTGSTKAVAVFANGQIAAAAQSHYSSFATQPGFDEQAPQHIWQAFVETVGTVASKMGYAPACVSLSGCMHSLLLLNAGNQPLTPLITWADNRAAAVAERLRQSAEGALIYATTGTPLHAMSPLCKIIWFREQQPEVAAKVAKYVSVKELIWWRMFGTFEVDHSIASATGLFGIVNKRWSETALRHAGIQPEQLSRPLPTAFIRTGMDAAVAGALRIPPSTPVCIGASDGCLANVGSGALEQGVAAVTVGTSGAVRVASREPALLPQSMPFSYVLDEEIFICGGPTSNGGNVLQWIKKQLLGNDELTYEDALHAIAEVDGCANGLLCLPYLHGERAPVWDEEASGVFIGVRSHHNNLHLARAAVEGVCFAILSVTEQLESSGKSINQLRISGGIGGSPVWLQMLADVTNRPVAVTQTEDASAVGAALLGLKATGLSHSYRTGTQAPALTYNPNRQKTALYRKGFEVYKTLYPSLRSAMHTLHQRNRS